MKILCKIFGHPNGQIPKSIFWEYAKRIPYIVKILCNRCGDDLAKNKEKGGV